MALTRCPNGHLFSGRKYGSICPYCNTTVTPGENQYKRATTLDEAQDEGMPYVGEFEVLDPVTGWLICIEGPSKGRDYRILSEKNFIGRAEDMHIQVLGDNYISRRNHAVVVYDPKKRKTVLMPGDSSGLAYLNNETVYTPVELTAYDVIEMGKSKFIFIPLCGEHFEWEEFQSLQEKR